MRVSRPTVTLIAMSLFALQSLVPLARTHAAAGESGPREAQPPELAQARLLAALRSKVPIEPIGLEEDPYVIWHAKEPPRTAADAVCGVRFEADQVHYRLSTFADAGAARAARFAVTHLGACGTCSTLQDLAVYLEKRDLTAPVRKCGIKWEASARLRCLEHLGFSTACARTWLYELQNTRRCCFTVCAWSWIKGEPPTQKDGRLNACLQCDEDRSGPVFKATAGRTRRNSGIRSSIPRREDEIAPVVHDYVPDLATR